MSDSITIIDENKVIDVVLIVGESYLKQALKHIELRIQ